MELLLRSDDHVLSNLQCGCCDKTAVGRLHFPTASSGVRSQWARTSVVSTLVVGRSSGRVLGSLPRHHTRPFAVGRLHFPTASSGLSGPELPSCRLNSGQVIRMCSGISSSLSHSAVRCRSSAFAHSFFVWSASQWDRTSVVSTLVVGRSSGRVLGSLPHYHTRS
jgi:hypothetical protein